jgi:pilus assembly protein CpaB
MSQKSAATETEEEILVATMQLPAGTLLRAQDVMWQQASQAALSDAIIRPSGNVLLEKPELDDQTRASVYGAVLRNPIEVGQPIRRGTFVKPGDRDFLQVVLTPGERAIAIPVSTGGASTGLLTPGDRVDVILTQDFKAADTALTRRSVGETVVQDLRVLAIDAPDTKGNFGRTVTLEVTADQAQKINVATELGKLSVTLRSATLAAEAPSKPTWAGDVSPALYGAAESKPVPVTAPPPVLVFHGTRHEEVKQD